MATHGLLVSAEWRCEDACCTRGAGTGAEIALASAPPTEYRTFMTERMQIAAHGVSYCPRTKNKGRTE
jgi:hypothetical protein